MIPNVLFATALLFAVATLTRSTLGTTVASVGLYVLYFISAALTDSPMMAGSRPGASGGLTGAGLDPFGLTAFFYDTRHWTILEKNTRFIEFGGPAGPGAAR